MKRVRLAGLFLLLGLWYALQLHPSAFGTLLFAGDPGGNLVAYDPTNGNPLWHARIGVSTAPETSMLDGHQYVLVGAVDSVYALQLS